MKSLKVKHFSIAALAVAFLVSVSAFLGINLNFYSANAQRTVPVSATQIFSASSSNGAEVWSHQVEVESDAEEAQYEYYTMFVIKQTDGAINYKKNLAYKWFYNDVPVAEDKDDENTENTEDKEDETETVSEFKKGNGLFNMEIGFAELGFEKFIIKFESQQYTQTKDGKSTNYVIFQPVDESHVKVLITDEQEEDDWEFADDAIALSAERISIKFTDRVSDKYLVEVSDGTNKVEDAFQNVGGNYAKQSSSTTTPVTPLSFSAKYAEEENAPKTRYDAKMVLYSLNGQSFQLSTKPEEEGADDNKHFKSGSVNDNTPAVICLNKDITFVQEGKELSFSYEKIDVLATSPKDTIAYYMLTENQANDSDFKANDYSEKGPFRTIKSDENQQMIPHVEHYVPTAGTFNDTIFNSEDFNVTAAAKVYIKLLDTTSTGGVETYVLLDWYVDDDYKVTVQGNDYIAVATDKIGVTYAYMDENSDWEQIKKDYQEEVDKAAEKQELKAGSKNYFYLPSVENLFSANDKKQYVNLTYSIYYMTSDSTSFSSATGKTSSTLSINLTKSGEYLFTVIATDAASNKMYYFDEDDEKVEIESSTSNVLEMYKDEDEKGLSKYLPWFRFTVSNSDLSIEDPGNKDTAYVGSKYTSISFDINGVSYKTTYKLYRFKSERYFVDNGTALTYDEFMEQKDELLCTHRNEWFEEIRPSSELDEDVDKEEYDKFIDYAWDNSALTFTPQDANAFYLVTCTVTDNDIGTEETAYMGISASPKVRALKGEDTWLQDNLTSVILLSIAGAALIGIVLLLVIKPKDKGDLDEVYEGEKAKKSKKKNK